MNELVHLLFVGEAGEEKGITHTVGQDLREALLENDLAGIF